MPRRQVKNDAFLFIHWRTEFVPVHQQVDFHRSMPDSFVPVDERVIENEGEAERCRFGSKIWIEISSTKALARLSQGGFTDVEVSNSTRATPLFYDGSVKLQHFSKDEVSIHERRR